MTDSMETAGAPDISTKAAELGMPAPEPPLSRTMAVPLAITALLLGAVGNTLVFPAFLGIGATGWCLLVLAVMAVFHCRESRGTFLRAAGIYGLAAAAAACMAWRDTPLLRFGSVALYLFAAIWIQLAATGVSFRKLPLSAFLLYLAGSVQAWVLVLCLQCGMARLGAPRMPREMVKPLLRGLIFTAILIVLFGTLLAKADARFSAFLENFITKDWATWLSRLFWFCAFSALALTITSNRARLTRYWAPDRDDTLGGRAWLGRMRLSAVELLLPMVALDMLFGAFVLTQLTYLFGGTEYVQAVAGVTYAEYARRGFFELCAVAALVLPMQLLFDWWLRDAPKDARKLFHFLALIQSGLLLCILASAAHRMALYQVVYGLTRLRIFASAGILWIGLAIAWHAATVLRGHRDRFLGGALMAAILLFFALEAASPDALIAWVNTTRISERAVEENRTAADGFERTYRDKGAARQDSDTLQLDVDYLAGLSADAIPVLHAALGRLPERDRTLLAAHLREYRDREALQRARAWSWSRWRARMATASP